MKSAERSGIYCIENKINNKKYIGQSISIHERWKKHISELNNNKHHNDYLQKAWNKYGENQFGFYVLEYCDESILDEKEIYYINLYQTLNRSYGYNLKSGGQDGGSIYSDDTRKKMSDSVKKAYSNEQLREMRRIAALKQWADPEMKNKISGKNNCMYGKTHTDEARKKISEAKIGKPSHRRNTTPILCIELDKQFKDATEASKELHIDSSAILKVCRGERKTCGGYHWEFLKMGNNIS